MVGGQEFVFTELETVSWDKGSCKAKYNSFLDIRKAFMWFCCLQRTDARSILKGHMKEGKGNLLAGIS
jgi:hypothetical protein